MNKLEKKEQFSDSFWVAKDFELTYESYIIANKHR